MEAARRRGACDLRRARTGRCAECPDPAHIAAEGEASPLPACGERVRPSAERAERSEAGVRGRCRKRRAAFPQRLLVTAPSPSPAAQACCLRQPSPRKRGEVERASVFEERQSMNARKRRVALIGTGHRGLGTWGKELIQTCGDTVEIVALCDRTRCGSTAPARSCAVRRASTPISTTSVRRAARDPDRLHPRRRPRHAYREGARSGLPCRHREADGDDRREVPPHPRGRAPHRRPRRRHLQLPLRADRARGSRSCSSSGVIGDVASVDFHWYLDVQHGADYFRRWHAYARIPAACSSTRRRTISTCSTGISTPTRKRFSRAAT